MGPAVLRLAAMTARRPGRKGIEAISLAVYAIVGMAIVVFLFGVLGLGQQLADSIQAFIFGQLTPGVASTDLANALECSYVRCSQGCAAAAAITVHFPTVNFNCKAHCESAIESYNAANPNNKITDGRLCGEAAKEHPLIVEVSDKNMYISVDDLNFEEVCKGQKCCIFPSDKNNIRTGSIAAVIKDSFIKKVEITEDKCEAFQGTPFPMSLCSDGILYCPARTVTLNPDTYYVWTIKYDDLLGRSIQNIVWDSYTAPIAGASFVCCSGVWQTGTDCATGTKQDATACDPAASDGVVACTNKCTSSGYEQSFYGTQPRKGDYEVCSCMTIPGQSTTTTTLPDCSSTSCGSAVTKNCKCGTATCYVSNPDYCCASKNSCNSYQDTCKTACSDATTTTLSQGLE